MVSAAEHRILIWLGRFDESLQKAWDVPRDISLPGIAEGIGVVRSALHKPMKRLVSQGLVTTRQAHVLGGGGRKRTVHHITSDGRASAVAEVPTRRGKAGVLHGNAPALSAVIGREQVLNSIEQHDGGPIWIAGLAGIGKSALLRRYVENEIERGRQVRWCSASIVMGAAQIVENWLGEKDLSQDTDILIEWMQRNAASDLLVIDDLHLLSGRFLSDVLTLIDELAARGFEVISTFRPPLDSLDVAQINLEGLAPEHALELLQGFDVEIANALVEHLDGHPLALSMVSEDASLELARKGLEAFLDEEILAKLAENVKRAVDELAIQLEPVEAGMLSHQNELGPLDEHALLRRVDSPLVGLQQLIRNLRLDQMSPQQRRQMHLEAAKRMADQKDERARLHAFYHRLMGAADDLGEWMQEHGAALANREPAAVAGLLEDAKANACSLSWYAALAECEIGAVDRALGHLAEAIANGEVAVDDGRVIALRSRLHLLAGEVEQAAAYRDQAVGAATGIERARLIAAEASRRLDDRLPLEPPEAGCLSALDSVELSGLDKQEKRDVLTVIASIRHGYALATGDFDAAACIRRELAGASAESPIYAELEWRAIIASGEQIEFDTDQPLRRIGALAWRLEHAEESARAGLIERLDSTLEQCPILLDRPAGRRALALVWTWKGEVEQSIRTPAWSQAVHCWLSAECPRAAAGLQNRLHAWLVETGRS